MLEKMIAQQNRETLVALLTDESVDLDTLRVCVAAAMGGDAELTAQLCGATAAPATKSGGNGATAAPAKPPKPPKPAATSGGNSTIDIALEGLRATGQGFATGDLAAASGCSKDAARRALKKAVSDGRLHKHGKRRFTRYAATEAAAKAASEADRAG